VNDNLATHLQQEDNVALFIENLPGSNMTEEAAAEFLWQNIPGGLNIEPDWISVRGTSCIVCLTRDCVADFFARICSQGNSVLRIKAHVSTARSRVKQAAKKQIFGTRESAGKKW
jgi:hypothetical protein